MLAPAELGAVPQRRRPEHPEFTFIKGTLQRFIRVHGLSIGWEQVEEHPGWLGRHPAFHYRIKLRRRDGREIESYYSKGLGLREPPTVEEVLLSAAWDARIYDNAVGGAEFFAERHGLSPADPLAKVVAYADEFGFDPFDGATQADFKDLEEWALEFKEFLGERAYWELAEIEET